MPEPEVFFVSPLQRCGETLEIEWGWHAEKEKGQTGISGIVVEVCTSRFELSIGVKGAFIVTFLEL